MIKTIYNIAVILTCHNRKAMTIKSLASVLEAERIHNSQNEEKINLAFFITDDGCTDGTSEAIKKEYQAKEINIIYGSGTLYWAGGMQAAWEKAYKYHDKWDFYLLMNDDTLFETNVFTQLLETHHFAVATTGKGGVYVGTCISLDRKELTYGGIVYSFPIIGRFKVVKPTGKPEHCDMTCANILMVSKNAVDVIGLVGKDYVHCCGDWAYGIKANKKGLPVLTTPLVCGICDNDHDTENIEREKVLSMSIKQRRDFFNHPLRSTSDKMLFMRKYQKIKYLLVFFAREMNIYCPKLYYWLSNHRPGTIKN